METILHHQLYAFKHIILQWKSSWTMVDTKSLNKYICAQSLMEFKQSWTLSGRKQLLYFLWTMVQSVAVHSALC